MIAALSASLALNLLLAVLMVVERRGWMRFVDACQQKVMTKTYLDYALHAPAAVSAVAGAREEEVQEEEEVVLRQGQVPRDGDDERF